jgi:hypothetical protein
LCQIPKVFQSGAACVFARQNRLIFGALMFFVLQASLDQMVVLKALPTIVGEFGGVELLSGFVAA